MGTYRRKPVTVEAVQFFVEGDHPAPIKTFSGWIVEGQHGFSVVRPGDFIVDEAGLEGFYPVAPEVFLMTHEPVEGSFDDFCALRGFRA